MITRTGELRLFDFGAAWLAQREPWIYEASVASLQGATPSYASADRLSGDAPTTRDDIFSFCCLAYELLSGDHPYDRRPANVARDNGARLQRFPDLNARQWRVLRQGLAFRREDRPTDMRAVLRELGAELNASQPTVLFDLQKEPPVTASRVSGLSMVLLGTGAFAVVHVLNAGGLFEDVPWMAAAKPWFTAAERFVFDLFK
jgi:serine/threonine protein kinase